MTSEIDLINTPRMTITEQLLAEIEAFLMSHDMRPTQFGELACRDRHAVRRLREGHSITTRRYEQLKSFMRSYASKAA